MTVGLRISLPDNLAIVRFGKYVTEADYEVALELYATHPNARHGQNLLCDMRQTIDGTVDMAKRLAMQVTMDQVLGSGPLPRTILYLVPNAKVGDLIATCVALWQPNHYVTGTIIKTEAEAISRLGLQTPTLDDLIPIETYD
ncbi:hypothetical protein [Thalassovita mediterranea]|uniref:Uncharacterized protein n=1 Tax=Thalassovita mediterranea TaxID=340021 RepID=A0A0P1HEJ8_9RHOB|nr:hypothetical protein [Thalassovita mediterranea]CUH85409.1 hypothetical protein TM5383_02642 [Thalassovita mediterranea]SIS35486.1 hypothetical protein SAMN05421685_11620 [Thalassovita mediterranea]